MIGRLTCRPPSDRKSPGEARASTCAAISGAYATTLATIPPRRSMSTHLGGRSRRSRSLRCCSCRAPFRPVRVGLSFPRLVPGGQAEGASVACLRAGRGDRCPRERLAEGRAPGVPARPAACAMLAPTEGRKSTHGAPLPALRAPPRDGFIAPAVYHSHEAGQIWEHGTRLYVQGQEQDGRRDKRYGLAAPCNVGLS